MPYYQINKTILSSFFLENVSEHLQIHGSEVQDSHKEIVKDLADVRHQAQDIYHKIGKLTAALFCVQLTSTSS